MSGLEHTIVLDDGRVAAMYIRSSGGAMVGEGGQARHSTFYVMARLDDAEHDTGIQASLPPNWARIERETRDWVQRTKL